jgi:hypothetical protein
MMIRSTLYAIVFGKLSGVLSWEFAGEERLPGELRVVNEGLAHGK